MGYDIDFHFLKCLVDFFLFISVTEELIKNLKYKFDNSFEYKLKIENLTKILRKFVVGSYRTQQSCG